MRSSVSTARLDNLRLRGGTLPSFHQFPASRLCSSRLAPSTAGVGLPESGVVDLPRLLAALDRLTKAIAEPFIGGLPSVRFVGDCTWASDPTQSIPKTN